MLSGLSQMLMLSDRYAESAALAREAIAVAALVPDGRSVEGHARCNLGTSLAYLGRLEEGITELREARRIAEEQFDDVDDIARALVNLHSILYDHGRLAEAAELALENVRVTETLGLQRRKGVWSRCDAAQVLILLGRFDEAGRLLDEARLLQPQGIDAFRTDLTDGMLWLRRGDLDRARALMERAEARRRPDHRPAPARPALRHPGGDRDLAGRRRGRGALVGGRAAPTGARDAPRPPRTGASPARRRRRCGPCPPRPADARALLDRAAALLAATPARGTPAELEVRTAEAELSGDLEAWLAVAAAWERLGDPYRTAYSHLRLAELLLDTGAGRDEAAEHLGLATATARRIGADGLVARAEDLGRRSRLKVEAAPDNPYRLTAREAEVLALVADGLSDRDIGDPTVHQPPHRRASRLEPARQARRRPPLRAGGDGVEGGAGRPRFVCGLTWVLRLAASDESGPVDDERPVFRDRGSIGS